MKLYQLILPTAAILLSSLVSSVAMARPVKAVYIYKPHAVTSYKYVLPIQGVRHHHRAKQKRPVYIVYTPSKLKQRHFSRLTALQRASFENAFVSAVSDTNGGPVYWTASGTSGSISVFKDLSLENGCRSYIQTVKINQKEEKIRGVACRQVDSSWKIIS
ncbi:MAG: hypothetical protein V7776_07065 [Halopseudomonas aestusnigri]